MQCVFSVRNNTCKPGLPRQLRVALVPHPRGLQTCGFMGPTMFYVAFAVLTSIVSVQSHIHQVTAEGAVNLLKEWGLHKHFGKFSNATVYCWAKCGVSDHHN